MKILCIGDSLGLPREEVSYEETWFFRLKNQFPQHDFIYKFKRSLTSRDVVGKSNKDFAGDYFEFYHPDLVIAQFGICDCAPRYINEGKPAWIAAKLIFRKLRLEKLFWKTIKKVFSRSADCVYVSYDDFASYVNEYAEKCLRQDSQIIFIEIGTPSLKVQEISPNLLHNVIRYNQVFEELAKKNPNRISVVNPLNMEDESFYIDGYHTNGKGFERVYHSLSARLAEI